MYSLSTGECPDEPPAKQDAASLSHDKKVIAGS